MITKLKHLTRNAALIGAAAFTVISASASDDFVVHEWGTFTDVQGGDGALIAWQAFQIGDLPNFVYNWMNPGLNRQAPMNLLFGKGGLTTLQRMETPVIYFYANKETTADVRVGFPKGTITEWYPQAAQIGPGTVQSTNLTAAHIARESLIHWKDVHILPSSRGVTEAASLAMDTNGTHYFAARETEAAVLRVNNLAATNAADEREKFLFYRGSGSFTTPLTVTVNDAGVVSVENTGAAPLASLFLLNVHDGTAQWAQMDTLAAHTRKTWLPANAITGNKRLPLAELQTQIGDAMGRALVEAGLFPAEAKAMVKTWSNAWFAEEGVRVLYLLPRDWTDQTLPLALSPRPDKLVRVMVGRAEIILPETEKIIARQLKRSNDGSAEARKWLQEYSQKFGRFASPAFQLARKSLAPPENKPVATAARN